MGHDSVRSASRYSTILLLACCLFGGAAQAQLTLSVDQLSPAALPGGTLDFSGVITNQTGSALSSTDFFFNFFNYDPSDLTPVQILGMTDFTLPNNTFSADTALFSLAVSPGIAAGPQPLGVTLEDVNGDISNEVDINAGVGNVAPAPEIDPSSAGTALTLLLGLMAVLGRRRTQRRFRTI